MLKPPAVLKLGGPAKPHKPDPGFYPGGQGLRTNQVHFLDTTGTPTPRQAPGKPDS
ncbi:MAG: hypothetical protein ACYTGS_19865 [Planctomycetota bacterium]